MMKVNLKRCLSLLIAVWMVNIPLINGIETEKIVDTQEITNEFDATKFNFENCETNTLDEVKDTIKGTSEMSDTEQAFLNGLVRKYKPKKILELGVSAGASSAILLNASKDIESSKVYSIDKLKYYYKNRKKSPGYLVEENLQKLTKNWKLYTGDIPCSFIDEIGNGIDFVLIDTVHARPGEITDFLSVLPYLKENAIVCFHGIGSTFDQKLNFGPAYYANEILFSCIKGEKILPKEDYKDFCSNIGAIKLDKDQKKSFLDYFLLLSLPWEHIPGKKDSQKLIDHFKKHYDSDLVNYYKKGLAANTKYRNKVSTKHNIK